MTPAEQAKADKNLLERIDRDGENLSEWETDRIEEWLTQVDAGKPLTEKQREKAEEIETQRCD